MMAFGDDLLDILRENQAAAKEAASEPPVACPNDGTPLEENDAGVLNCPMGDYRAE